MLYPKDKLAHERLLLRKQEIQKALDAREVEKNITWHRYIVGGYPRRVFSTGGRILDIDAEKVAQEAETQTGVKPVQYLLSKSTTETDIETT